MIPKFRFYNKKLNKIYEVVGIDFLNEQVDCILPEMNEDIANWDFNVGALIQSTGLKDINGKEIYEGDILKYSNEYRVVEMHNGAWIVRAGEKGLVVKMAVLSGAEIIGNKFEHPHLIGEEQGMDNQIFIIIYREYISNGEIKNVFSNEKYFNNKDKAIHQLEKEGFKHICDDEYSKRWYLHAEIMLLELED